MSRQPAKIAALIALLAALWTFAAAQPPTRSRIDRRGIAGEAIGKNQLLGRLVEEGVLVARPREETLSEAPPTVRGMLELVPTGAPPEPLPSTALGAAEARAHPERDFVSIAIDPRDWDASDQGIFMQPWRRGASWTRGACVTLFVDGRPALESTAGVCIHGDTSRRRWRKSLRVLFTPRFGANGAVDTVIPGASGKTFVLHSDWRRQRFVNPIGYELLRRAGVEAPRTRPVRVLINGAQQPGIYFATEYVDEDYFTARNGQRIRAWFQTRDDEEPKSYRVMCAAIRTHSPSRVLMLGDQVDVSNAHAWLSAIMLLAPFDSVQGRAYRVTDRDPWRWVAYDVDWGLGPWPEIAAQSRSRATNVIEYLTAQTKDARSQLLVKSLEAPSQLRAMLLQRVRHLVDHEADLLWWRGVLDRYRGHARRLLGDAAETELSCLDDIQQWLRGRGRALRRELSAEFDLGPARRIRVRVSEGARADVEGFSYERDWSGYAFDGEELTVRADPTCTLQVNGRDAGDGELLLTVDGDLDVLVSRRS